MFKLVSATVAGADIEQEASVGLTDASPLLHAVAAKSWNSFRLLIDLNARVRHADLNHAAVTNAGNRYRNVLVSACDEVCVFRQYRHTPAGFCDRKKKGVRQQRVQTRLSTMNRIKSEVGVRMLVNSV